jgi:YesN/AraC family two-component response regulator
LPIVDAGWQSQAHPHPGACVCGIHQGISAPHRFDIVLTDEVMPDLMGTDLAREIRLLRPDTPVVLTSGYIGTHLYQRASAAAIQEVLRKPLRSKDIAECLGRALHTFHL